VHHRSSFLCAIAAACIAAPGPAADAERPATDTPAASPGERFSPRVEFTFTPGVWLPRLSGDVEFVPGGGENLKLEGDFELDDLEPTFQGEVNIRYERWQAWVSAFDFSTSGSGPSRQSFRFGDLSVARGELVESEFDLASAALEIGYTFQPVDEAELELRLAPTVGLRYFDLEHSVAAPARSGSPEVNVSAESLAVYGGGRLQLAFRETFYIGAGVGFGASLDGGFYSHVTTGASWHPHPNIGAYFGYRLVVPVLEEGDYELDARLAGLFLGASIRF